MMPNSDLRDRFAELPPFGKELLTWLTICFLYIMSICNFNYLKSSNKAQSLIEIITLHGESDGCLLETRVLTNYT